MNRQAARPEVALYLHVPFCRTKCAYCDFTSATDADDPLPDDGVMWAVRAGLGDAPTFADAYCAAVPLFLQEFADHGVLGKVPSIYIGGGTPTVLGERLPALVSAVLDLVTLAQDAEVTCEANPESVDAALVSSLVDAGVNRFSLGVQSFDDGVLALLGRCHTAEQADAAARALVRSGARVSVDLMCGIPGQSAESWHDSVERAIATGAGHVSVYPLSVEEGTPLDAAIAAGRAAEPDPDLAADMMIAAAEILRAAGFERYEIASYARPGEQSRHNLSYWRGVPYLGVGPGAASMMPVGLALETPMKHYVRTWPTDWRARFVINDTLASFLGYLWDRQPATLEPLTLQDAVREDAMLGMRTAEGIDGDLAEAAGALPALRELAEAGLVEFTCEHWKVTDRGWLLGNVVFERVWAG